MGIFLPLFSGIFGCAFLGIFAWSVQLGNRVSMLEQSPRISVLESRHTDLLTLINTKFEDMNRRLDRIERAMNGALHIDHQ